MRQSNYLNMILTVNAILLAAVLWVGFASGPVFDREASAQVRTRFAPAGASILNAGAQREKIVKSLDEVKKSVDAMRNQLEMNRIGVRVINADEIRAGG